MFFYSFICLVLLLFPLETRFKSIYQFLNLYFWVLKKVCHIDYQVIGLENIPKDRVGIILSKHQSTFETFAIPLYFPLITPIAKRELVWIPFFGWGLAMSKPILINRSDKRSAMMQIIGEGSERLKEGRWIMFFPEGTRVPYGKVGTYRLGGTRLACATGAPIIPIAHNSGKVWPRRKFIKNPGTVTIVIGPLMESVGKTPEGLLEEAKGWIEGKMKEL
jgi:1-acyl-sn-glycerol-3-phosphate acyltransferase